MATIIKSSSELRKNYNSIAEICRTTRTPVFLTRNGTGDTVLMDVATYNKREDDLLTAERFLSAERARLQGVKGYTVDEFEEICGLLSRRGWQMDNADKKYYIYIDPAANYRMAEHMEFLTRVSENAAKRLLVELMTDIRSLKKMPFRYPIYNYPYLPLGKYRSLVIKKRYIIVYQIDGDCVYVDDIQDSGQSDDKNLLYKD